ncbi:cytochrome P450 [Rhodoligotrophos appendicifer]|uniref:cytochrome P450 n=1 Tax=Rhodoligotrophos appendicifer TaxID=987056 RepID=UPI0011847664|nr:cytochrome P450 [Rhodoligotrophos appendicifer]
MKFSTIPFASEHMDLPSVAHMTQISRFDEINQILLSSNFIQGGFTEARERLITDTLITVDGKRHSRRRGILSRIMNDSHIAAMREQFLNPVISQTLTALADSVGQKDGVLNADLVPLAQRCIQRIAAAVAGIDCRNDAETTDRLVTLVKRIGAGVQVEFSTQPAAKVLSDAQIAQQEFYDEFFKASYDRRTALADEVKQGKREPSDLPKDVLMQTILHDTDAWDGDDGLPLREICLFLVGASATTTGSLILLFLRLEEWFEEHPEDRALIESDPNFLRSAAFESLRLTVGAPARVRIALQDVQLASGREIKQGESVALLLIPANMSKDRFGPDADKFNPHRDVGNLAPWGLSFGAGAHACPGRPLVVGNRSMKARNEIDGSLVSLARGLYRAGITLDETRPPVPETATHYSAFKEVPIKFTRIDVLRADSDRHEAVG